MIRFFYSLLVYFLLPFTCFKLIYRGFRQPDYLKYWGERYGFYSASTKKIWAREKYFGSMLFLSVKRKLQFH